MFLHRAIPSIFSFNVYIPSARIFYCSFLSIFLFSFEPSAGYQNYHGFYFLSFEVRLLYCRKRPHVSHVLTFPSIWSPVVLAATYQLLCKLHHVSTFSCRAHLHQSVRPGSEMKTMFLTLKLLNPISAKIVYSAQNVFFRI